MKFNFRKISAVIASGLMTVSAVGFAAAANFPAPFVAGGSAYGAVVYGTGAGALDQPPANSIGNYLSSKVTVGTGAPTGDSVQIIGPNDNLNLGNGWNVLTGTNINYKKLPVLLAKGTYVADDSDTFDYTQKIEIGNPTFTHFRKTKYENEVGLDRNTPAVGFRLASNTFVMNYTMDFTTNAESDITSAGRLEDIEGSDITLFGKTYYVSKLLNGTSNTYLGKMTLLDSATIGKVSEGETATVTTGGQTYEISMRIKSTTQVYLTVNGKETNALGEGDSAGIGGDVYVGIRDLAIRDLAGSVGSATFSIGSGKLEITSGSDIKLNDKTIEKVTGFVHRGTGSSGSEKIDKIVIRWKTDGEQFLTPASELVMPGFGGLKFTMADLVRSEEEKITIAESGDGIELGVPIESGDANFNILYAETATGNITGIGESATLRLATSGSDVLTFYEFDSSGNEYHQYFVASYNSTSVSESYLLEATINQEVTDGNGNRTTIKDAIDGTTYYDDSTKTDESAVTIGNVQLTITDINYTESGIESVTFSAGTNVNFNTIFTKGGLKIYLPYEAGNETVANGAINLTGMDVGNTAGHNEDSFWLFMDGENKDEDVAGGTEFNLTIDSYGSANAMTLQVSQVIGSSTSGYEVGQGTGDREVYIVDDVAPRIMHYTQSNPDTAEVYYPTGDSETYAQVYLTSSDSTLSAAGQMVFKDSEKSSWSDKNVVVVGGSCINSAAADLLGGALCESAFTDATGVGAGQYVVQSFADGFSSGKIALLVAGYHAADTLTAASKLIEPGYAETIITDGGTKYIGTVGVSGSSTMSKQ